MDQNPYINDVDVVRAIYHQLQGCINIHIMDLSAELSAVVRSMSRSKRSFQSNARCDERRRSFGEWLPERLE